MSLLKSTKVSFSTSKVVIISRKKSDDTISFNKPFFKRLLSVGFSLLCLSECFAGSEKSILTKEHLDELCSESFCEDAGGQYRFDSEIYQKIPRINIPFGTYTVWDYNYSPCLGNVKKRPECTTGKPYMIRAYGFKYGGWLEPDEMGKLFLDNRIMYCGDQIGVDVLSALKIAKKYGLQYIFVADKPSEPFLMSEIASYTEKLRQALTSQRDQIKQNGDMVKADFLKENLLWHITFAGGTLPTAFFLMNCQSNFSAVNSEFKEEMGFDLPLWLDLSESKNRAKRSKMWQWAVAKHGNICVEQAKIFREIIAGQNGLIISHFHAGLMIDYERVGEAYDLPGPCVRPMLGSCELDYIYYVGYLCRLFNDLTDRIPQYSIRINIPWANARAVPSPRAVKYWHSQAVQNGTRLFYMYFRDFFEMPLNANDLTKQPDKYSGIFLQNPDKSTLPELRFNTLLEISKKLGHSNIFVPPKSKTGIFISLDTNFIEQEGWFRNFSTYIELTQAGVWANFISDQELREQTERLDQVNVLYLPMIKFEHPNEVNDIFQFVVNGGTIVTSDPNIFAYDDWGNPTENLRKKIFGVVSLKKRTSPDNTIYLKADCSDTIIKPYSRPYEIEQTEDAEVIGVYNDGKAAAVCKKLGSGKAYFFAGSILDTYLHRDDYTENCYDTGRAQFLKKIETENNCPDLSWIWNINVDNVHKVTGEAETEPVKIGESIVFE